MGSTHQHGFTIIETMLFLAITGLLVVAILGGAGTAINHQRYRDSVNSLAGLLQDQYANVVATHNDRTNNWSCTSGGLSAATTGSARGTSECALVGQVVRSKDGAAISSEAVVATNMAAITPDMTSDAAVIRALKLQSLGSVDPSQIDTRQLEWGASMVKPGGDKRPATFSILIVRSPLSGAIRTFIDNSSGTTSLGALATDTNLSRGVTLCVDPQGLFVGGMNAVELLPDSGSAVGVRVKGTDSTC